LYGLLHDAAESVFGDIVQPVKELCPELDNMEYTLMLDIFEHHGLERCMPDIVKRADYFMYLLEQKLIFGRFLPEYNDYPEFHDKAAQGIPDLSVRSAKGLFMNWYRLYLL